MNCDECRDLLSELEAGELDEGVASQVRAHLTSCPECSRLFAAVKSTAELVESLSDEEPPRSLSLKILARVEAEASRNAADLPEILTSEQVARFLNVPLDALVTDDLPGFEIGDQLRYRRDRVLEWIEQREREFERRRIYARNLA